MLNYIIPVAEVIGCLILIGFIAFAGCLLIWVIRFIEKGGKIKIRKEGE